MPFLCQARYNETSGRRMSPQVKEANGMHPKLLSLAAQTRFERATNRLASSERERSSQKQSLRKTSSYAKLTLNPSCCATAVGLYQDFQGAMGRLSRRWSVLSQHNFSRRCICARLFSNVSHYQVSYSAELLCFHVPFCHGSSDSEASPTETACFRMAVRRNRRCLRTATPN